MKQVVQRRSAHKVKLAMTAAPSAASAGGPPKQLKGPFREVSDWFRRRALRTQLFLVVNLIVGTGLIAFLYLDYRHSVRSAIHAKIASLSDEARAIAVAIEPLEQGGANAVQNHINAVCTAMDRIESPGHMIEVRVADRVLESHPSLHGETHEGDDLEQESRVVGQAFLNEVHVAISERTSGTVRETQREAVLRAAIIAASAVVGAGLINLLLLRLVNAPIRDLTIFVRGVGRGEFGLPLNTGGSAELTYLASEVSAMSAELATRETDRQRQLSRARQLQKHLMSGKKANDHRWSATAFQPADEVAGDFAEIMDLDDGSVLICLADVSGHGIAAAMGAAMIKALLLSLDVSRYLPAELLNQMNVRYLEASLPEDFVSMIVVRIRATRDTATYASAGHETCYIHRHVGQVMELQSTGTLLGIGEDADCQNATVSLNVGDTIVLVSDGVSEAMNEHGDLYGRPRLVELIAASTSHTPGQLVTQICDDVERHRRSARRTDDMTVVAFTIDSQN